MPKTVSQRKFVKGLNAATGILSEQQGSIQRGSNLVLTQRGSLQVCDGSAQIAALPGIPVTFPLIEWIDAYLNYVVGQYPYFVVLAQRATPVLPNNVANINIAFSGSGTNPAGTYVIAVVGVDASIANGGQTGFGFNQSPSGYRVIIASSSFSTLTVTWSSLAGVSGYNIYQINQDPSLGIGLLVNFLGSTSGVSSTTFVTAASLSTTFTTAAPQANTTAYLGLFSGSPSTTALGTNIILTQAASFLAITFQPAIITPGDPRFNGNAGLAGFSPYGGFIGSAESIPHLLQFAQLEILILGNGLPPMSYNPATGATPTTLSNTFQASYPNWQSGVSWSTDSQIAVLSGGTNFLFSAIQGGVSGTITPSWNFTLDTQTADGSVIWKSGGAIPANIAPRGAAHAVVYAGSLWLFNTSPLTTSDQIDGPTCVKMSDSNNPNSWNPVNTAFIGKDDGTQITGAMPFTIAAVGISPTGSMAVFKEFQTYQIIGVFGSNNFEIQPAQTDMGCIASRSIQFIPGFGVVRYTHLGFAVYDGVNDRLISEEIRPYLYGGFGQYLGMASPDERYVYLAKSTQSVKPPMYMCAMPLTTGTPGFMTRIFCYDLILKAWVIIDLPFSIFAMNRIKAGEGYPLVVIGKSDGTIHRIVSGDGDFGGVQISWNFQTQDVFGEGASQRLFYREVTIRGWGTPQQAKAITITPVIDGVTKTNLYTDVIPQDPSSNQFEVRAEILVNAQIAHANISGQGQVVIDSVDWSVEPKSQTAKRVIG